VRGGAVAGLSVGYRALSVRQGVRRELLSVELVEVSLVAVPMQALARVEVVA
jgi:phage head maturation protease